MIAFLIFLFLMSFLVFIHELGHFMAAKKAGVRVDEFGLGIPPKIFGKRVGETEYTLNLLPFGGFVRLAGEDEGEGNYAVALKDPENFLSKSARWRGLIIVAGVIMNILMSFILYYIFFAVNDFKSQLLPVYFNHKFRFGEEKRISTVITGVENSSPASVTKLANGEAIVDIAGVKINSVPDIKEALSKKAGESVKITLVDLKKPERPTRVLDIVPKLNDKGVTYIGVSLGTVTTLDYSRGANKVFSGVFHAYNMASYTFTVLKNLVGISFRERTLEPVSASLSGPVGIFGVVKHIVGFSGREAFLSLLDLMAMLSLSLGIMNLLPIPALDGGRLVFVLLEMVTGKKVHPEKEALVHKIGMLVLLAIIVLVSIKDVRMFF